MSGLVSFSLSHDNASFDSIDNVFYPSRKRIFFSQKELGDTLLQDSIRRQMKIKEAEAESMIEDFVKGVKKALLKNKYCKIEGLGYLMNPSEHKIYFKDTFWKKCKSPNIM